MSVQSLHNRRLVIPNKSVELMAWTSKRWTSDSVCVCVQRDNDIISAVKVGTSKMDGYTVHYN